MSRPFPLDLAQESIEKREASDLPRSKRSS